MNLAGDATDKLFTSRSCIDRMYTIKTGLKGDRSAVKRDSENFYTWKRDVPPETRWLIKAGQGGSKAGRRDIAVEFGTVPPKAGQLTRMSAGCVAHVADLIVLSSSCRH